MRVLWLSNAPWSPSGYGEQTAAFVPRLQALGHDVAIAANYGLQAAQFDYGGTTVYPSAGGWGNATLGTYAEHFKADLVIALCDAWVLKPELWPDDLRVAVWAPLDHYPVPPAVLKVLQHKQVRTIAMSRFGEDWFTRFGLDPLYVPHGIDTNLFKPYPERKSQLRQGLGVPEDAFLVGMVAANKGNPSIPRKSFPQVFDAFARFARKHPDAWMYVHSDPQGGGSTGHGCDLDTLALAMQVPQERVILLPPEAWHLQIPKDAVANLYSAFDVLVNPSMGEGFGIPIVEAQACGCPVIASDHSAMTELTGAGWLVSGDRWWDELQSSFLIMPSVDSIENALEAAYESKGDQKIKDAAVEFAMQYDADLVTVEHWEPTLAALERPREVLPISRQVRRAEERKKAKATA